jgi:hypothetical protein
LLFFLAAVGVEARLNPSNQFLFLRGQTHAIGIGLRWQSLGLLFLRGRMQAAWIEPALQPFSFLFSFFFAALEPFPASAGPSACRVLERRPALPSARAA